MPSPPQKIDTKDILNVLKNQLPPVTAVAITYIAIYVVNLFTEKDLFEDQFLFWSIAIVVAAIAAGAKTLFDLSDHFLKDTR